VLFANASIAVFILLGIARQHPHWRRASYAVAGALALLVVLIRPNGIFVPAFAAATVALSRSPRRKWRVASTAAAAAVITSSVMTGLVNRALVGERSSIFLSLRQIMTYDIAAIAASDAPSTLSPEAVRAAKERYSPQRWDFLWRTPFAAEMQATPPAALTSLWRNLISQQPGTYSRHRLAAFRWLIWPPEPMACLPAAVGIAEAGPLNAAVGLPAAQRPSDTRLWKIYRPLFDTVLFRQGPYLMVAVGLLGLCLLRPTPGSSLAVPLLLCALLFALSWIIVTVACDFRYLFPLDAALPVAILLWSSERPLSDLSHEKLAQAV
jgi:hypothetical protein